MKFSTIILIAVFLLVGCIPKKKQEDSPIYRSPEVFEDILEEEDLEELPEAGEEEESPESI